MCSRQLLRRKSHCQQSHRLVPSRERELKLSKSLAHCREHSELQTLLPELPNQQRTFASRELEAELAWAVDLTLILPQRPLCLALWVRLVPPQRASAQVQQLDPESQLQKLVVVLSDPASVIASKMHLSDRSSNQISLNQVRSLLHQDHPSLKSISLASESSSSQSKMPWQGLSKHRSKHVSTRTEPSSIG